MYAETKPHTLTFPWELSSLLDEATVSFFYINIWFKTFINKIHVWSQEAIKIDN